jgi:uncharacterized membrane protein
MIFFNIKGTRWHKVLGYGYVVCMASLNISAMFIYDLFGRFGPFHVMAIISFFTLLAGYIPVYRRKPIKGWVQLHYYLMCWCYSGLLAAFASEILTRAPAAPFFPAVIAASVAIFAISGWLIYRRDPIEIIKRTP